MTLKEFSQQALELLLQGTLQRERLVEVHRSLQGYIKGRVTAEDLQASLDRNDPSRQLPIPYSGEESPF